MSTAPVLEAIEGDVARGERVVFDADEMKALERYAAKIDKAVEEKRSEP